MALEYRLLIEKEEIHPNDLERILSDFDWNYEQEILNKQSAFFSIEESIGYNIYLLRDFLTILEIESKEQEFRNSITFRIHKDYEDPLGFKVNILKLVLKIREIVNSEILLLFNGEIIILKSNHKEIIIGKTDFWSDQLLEVLENLDYKSQEFAVL